MLQTIQNNMTPEQFVYWLQGMLENHTDKLTENEVKSIKDHLAQVFCKKTPDYTVTTTEPNKTITQTPTPPMTFIC